MKEIFKKINGITLIIALLALIIGWQLGHKDVSLKIKNFKPSLNVSNKLPDTDKNIDFKLFWDTWSLLSEKYVDKKALDPQKMYYGAISGMVQAVGDPYTVFLPPESQKSTKEELGGSFDGVGIELGFNKDKNLVVIAPLKDTPAEKGGIRAGDLILKIDGTDATNMALPDAVGKIRGKKGTKISLDIFHENDTKPSTVELTRDTIIVKSVEESLKTTPKGKKISYIKLSRFGERTFAEWGDAVSSVLSQGSQGIILDVRNNPGGFLDGAVFIGSEFIDKGDIVMSENSQGERQHYPVNRPGKLLELPLIVLINKGSASASEIVAGAIQDDKRGTLVGTQSFGKGTIQESQDLPGGTGIHVTTAKWLTPQGRWIHNVGLTPDVKVEEATQSAAQPKKDVQLDKALELLDQ